jgi:myo-inositol-1(or 4)-monophosphatase
MEEYLTFATVVADEAAVIALQYFSFEIENTWKGDGTPLTVADTEINDLVIKKINEQYPDHSVYGEEKSDTKERSKYIWVCDPIDGTMPFSNGLPMFTFSIALVDQSNGQPILGLVNDPVMKNRYWAYKGGGAYRNGERISVSKNATVENTYVCTDGSGRDVGFSNLVLIKSLSEKGCRVMKLLSIIYGGVQVANGKFAGTVFYGKKAYDVASLKIITEEAGGKATDLNGDERRYDEDGLGFVASNGILHEELLKIVKVGKL